MAAPLKRTLGRPVCVTLQGEELFIDSLVAPYREQALALIRRQVRDVDHFIAVSDYCARYMSSFLEIPADRISVVPLGIAMDGYGTPEGGRHADEFRVGYLARIAPEKGLRLLAEAYVRLRTQMNGAPARLEVAGYLASEHRPYLDSARAVLANAGMQDEMTYHGEVDRAGKRAFLRGLDVLSVPATYDEPKGMPLLEAMASGVPVVQPRRGAFIEVVNKTGGGVLVDQDDPDALANGLHALWSDPVARTRLGRGGFDGVRAHYTIAHSADRLIGVYESLTSAASTRASKGVA
jgi:glycosyltransferase involved in cell wall biosynthesis